ncbi:DUF7541 family protein [Halosolutus gelatinilyticus]|uniref:DUF7541 family protein n=1 Tax=Halosolutus gelatinilyticus TaxID=2931975 RepID=UPI001FF5C0F1|nr:hypothetical protein [Halosolutus gelatinilyticus]
MADHSTRADRPTRTSPWPILLALGLVFSEVGIVIDLVPVAVGGLVLFAGSVAGFVTESGRVSSPWPIVAGLGAIFVAVGAALLAVGTDLVTIAGAEGLVGLSTRGLAIAVAGVVSILGAAIGRDRR